MFFITITNRPGTFSDAIARRVAIKLGFDIIDRETLNDEILAPHLSEHERHMINESPRFLLQQNDAGRRYLDIVKEALLQAVTVRSAILLGFSSALMLGDHPDALHIDITAPNHPRTIRMSKQFHIPPQEAHRKLELADRQYRRYVDIVFGERAEDSLLYHLTINTGRASVDAAVDMIVELYKDVRITRRLRKEDASTPHGSYTKDAVTELKNPSEVRFSRILDMYGIDWVYEPKTFPVERDEEGQVTMAFSPDFYLPRYNLYLELTVMNQKYTAKKNRKARLVRAQYPDVNVKVVYKRDFDALSEALDNPLRLPQADDTSPLLHGEMKEILGRTAILDRLDDMARAIDRDYPDGVLLIASIKDSFVLLTELMHRIHVPVSVDLIEVGIFESGEGETPLLRVSREPDHRVYQQDVLMVETMIRSGFTTHFMYQYLDGLEPKSLHVLTLISDPDRLLLPLPIRYRGFDLSYDPIIGFGLASGDEWRHLPGLTAIVDTQASPSD